MSDRGVNAGGIYLDPATGQCFRVKRIEQGIGGAYRYACEVMGDDDDIYLDPEDFTGATWLGDTHVSVWRDTPAKGTP